MKVFIQFNNQYDTYHAGDQVTGDVIIKATGRKQIVNNVTLQAKGEANVKILEKVHHNVVDPNTQRRRSRVQIVPHTSTELYFENQMMLVANRTELPSGESRFPFVVLLPAVIPSSFESKIGSVRYAITAKVSRHNKSERKCLRIFTVISPLDLNVTSGSRSPIRKTEVRTVRNACCFKDGIIEAEIKAPVSGFVSGQNVPLEFKIVNNSNKSITEVKCILRKNVEYTATYPRQVKRNEKLTNAEIRFSGVGKHDVWHSTEFLKIPPLPPSNLNFCNIIQLTYDIVVVLHIEGVFNRTWDIRLPIILGTIPLVELRVDQPSTSTNYPRAYEELPPPTYEECMTDSRVIDVGEVGTTEVVDYDFVPRYPSYNLMVTPQPSAPSLEPKSYNFI